jgi:hypothetical protein
VDNELNLHERIAHAKKDEKPDTVPLFNSTLDMGGEGCALLGTQIPIVKPARSCGCKNASVERECE